MRTAIALFTRDLRVRDNPMLAAAHGAGERIVPLFVLDDYALLTAHGRPNRFGFLCDALRDLDGSLRDRGGALVVRRGQWEDEVARLAGECGATSIHVARDVTGYARQRLARLETRASCEVVTHDGITIAAPDELPKPYVVFTPYFQRWLETPWRDDAPTPRQVALPAGIDVGVIPSATAPAPWVAGERAGLERVAAFGRRGLEAYEDRRDLPGNDATSRLSPYLHFGCISPSDVARRLWDRDGAEAFVRQLCWRDFFAQLLWWRPEVAHDDIRPGRAPRWRAAPGDVETWKGGHTGFPLVDAGMRQLRAEGWMHNRVRMVVASFLTRDLLVDWREGAAHFMDLLVDGDVANNQLNWQWVAGTGTDANPHRVLNPTVQGRRHDPDGTYVRRWVPELADCPADVDIHDPPFSVRRTCRYPEPIVDHNEAIEMWRESLPR